MTCCGIRVLVLTACCWLAVTGAAAPVDPLNRAHALETGGDFEAAREIYKDTISTTEADDGEYAIALVDPLVGLSRCYSALGDVAIATEHLRRAQHIIHRNLGVLDLTQVEILEALTELHLAQEDPMDAEREQELQLYLAERNFGEGSLEMVGVLEKLGKWYMDTGQYFQARKTVQREIELIQELAGETDPRLLAPMIMAAEIRRLQRVCCSHRQLEDVPAILAANPELSNDVRAEAYEAMGDAFIASRKSEEAEAAYRNAWALLGDDAARRKFAKPASMAFGEDLADPQRMHPQIYAVNPNRPPIGFNNLNDQRLRQLTDEQAMLNSREPQFFAVPRPDADKRWHITESQNEIDGVIEPQHKVVGRPFQFIHEQLKEVLPIRLQDEKALAQFQMEMAFTVNADGRARNVRVVSNDVPFKLASLMRDVVGKTRFRPRLDGGTPVATENFKLIQTFER